MKVFDEVIEAVRKLSPQKPLPEVDLPARLDEVAKGGSLKWRTSVVDFLKLIGVDSSQKSLDILSSDLSVVAGTPGSDERNEALRVAVFVKIDQIGGSIPSELLDERKPNDLQDE